MSKFLRICKRFYNSIRHISRPNSADLHRSFSRESYLAISLYMSVNGLAVSFYSIHLMQTHPAIVFLIFCTLTVVVAIPFQTILIFLGSYSKRNILRIFACLPVLKGFGYTLLIVQFYQLIICHTIAVYIAWLVYTRLSLFEHSMDYLFQLWSSCNFPEADESCISAREMNCTDEPVYELPISQFFTKSLLGQGKNLSEVTPDFRRLCISFFLCILMAACVTGGFKHYVRIYSILCTINVFCFIGISTVIAARSAKNFEVEHFGANRSAFNDTHSLKIFDMYHMWTGGNSFLQELQFWLTIFVHCSGALQASEMVWLGIRKPESLKPYNVPILINAFKLASIFGILAFLQKSASLYIVVNGTNVLKCKLVYDIFTPSTVTLEVLIVQERAEIMAALFVLFYFQYTFMDSILRVAIILETIYDGFECTRKHTLVTCWSMCLLIFAAQYIYTTGLYRLTFILWFQLQSTVVALLTYVTFSLSFNLVYSLNMIFNDYNFTYRSPFPRSIAFFWSLSPVIGLFLTGILIYWWMSLIRTNTIVGVNVNWGLGAVLFVFAPTFITFCFKSLQGINDDSYYGDNPEEDWGSPDFNTRHRRRRFNPERDISYRYRSVSCTHTCLLKVKAFEEEIKKQMILLEKAPEVVRGLKRKHKYLDEWQRSMNEN